MKFNEVDLNQNQINNMVPEQRSSPPDNPVFGQLYFDLISRSHKVYTASGWYTFNSNPTGIGTAGYGMGGYNYSASAPSSRIDKLSFTSDTNTSLSSSMNLAKAAQCTGYSSLSAGYAASGTNGDLGNLTGEIEKVVFTTDVCNSISAVLSQARFGTAGANSSVAGYAIAGYNFNVSGWNIVDKLTFSGDTNAVLTSTCVSYTGLGGGCNSSLAGYSISGYYYYASTNPLTTIDKVLFSDDSVSRLATSLNDGTSQQAAFNSTVAGYDAGGGGSIKTNIDKLVFSNESCSRLTSSFGAGRYSASGFNSLIAGYAAGGSDSPATNRIDKVNFSNDTSNSISSVISQSRTNPSGCENLN